MPTRLTEYRDYEMGDWFPEVPDATALAQMTDHQVAGILATAISSISEDGWCAGWLMEVEYRAWRWADCEGSVRAGQSLVEPEQVEALGRLKARLAGVWVACLTIDRQPDVFLVTAAEWEELRTRQAEQYSCSTSVL